MVAWLTIFVTVLSSLGGPAEARETCDPNLTNPYAWTISPQPEGLWDQPAQIRAYFDWLRDVERLKGDDWFLNLSIGMIRHNSGAGLIEKHGTVRNMLIAAYPDSLKFRRYVPDRTPGERHQALVDLGRRMKRTTLED